MVIYICLHIKPKLKTVHYKNDFQSIIKKDVYLVPVRYTLAERIFSLKHYYMSEMAKKIIIRYFLLWQVEVEWNCNKKNATKGIDNTNYKLFSAKAVLR